MTKSFKSWSREELEAVATCLRADLRTAGPRFSIEFAPLTPLTRMITSIPPRDDPPAFGMPVSGGLYEGGGLFFEDWDLTDDVERLPARVKQWMGSMHAAMGEPADTSIVLKVDEAETMWLEFWSDREHGEELADLINQVQDVVMETTTEMWPLCPDHGDCLRPERDRDWVTWTCPKDGASIAQFGELGSQSG